MLIEICQNLWRRTGRWGDWLPPVFLFLVTAAAAEEPPVAQAPAPQPLHIEEAVEYGLRHNPLLQAAEQEVKAAEAGVSAARADFFPRLDTSYSYRHFNDAPIAKFHVVPGTPPTEVQTSDTDVNHWQADLKQPLFYGFGLKAQYEMAKEERNIAGEKKSETRLDLLRGIRGTFIRTLLEQRLVEVARENVALLETHLQNAQSFLRQGLVPQNDVLKADVALANARQNETSLAKQLVVTRAQLNRLLGLEEGTELELEEWDKVPPKGEAPTVPPLQELSRRAAEIRPEIDALSASIREAEEGRRLAASTAYPHVSLFGSYYREGRDFTASENDFVNDNNAIAGVVVDWNLFEGGKTRANISRWEHRQMALRGQEQDLLRQIHVEVKNAYEKLQVARRNLATARVAVKQAEENVRITTIQYRQQVVISTEVLDADFFLAQARINYYQALYGYQLAWVDLERAVGTSL